MTELTSAGFVRTRLSERLAQLIGAAQAIFGADIDLSPDSMDGQHLGLFAERIADLDELAEIVWQSFDPDGATGQSQSRLVKINGIERSEGAYSTVPLTLMGTAGVLIPARSVVGNASGSVLVYTATDVRLDSAGTASVLASPDSMGAIAAPAGTLSVIKSPVYGWLSVTNASPMVIGKLREKDSTLRLRRTASVSKGNRNMVESLEAALRDLVGVIEARVLENASHLTDSNGLPPHSIHAVVLGGDDAAIASTIWARKTGGSPLIGSTAITLLDANDHPQVVRFSRPTDVRVIARVTISPRTGWTIAKPAQIKNALTTWVAENQTVGDELANSELYTPLNALGGFVTTSIELARFGQPLIEQNLSMLFYERASLDIADIEVVVT
jgi:uncharacterized phage protein gp47/JayE